LERLVNGEAQVENDVKQQMQFGDRGLKTKSWWKKRMKNMHIWLDFMCMPQPSAPSCTLKGADDVKMLSNTKGVQDDSHGASEVAKLLHQAVESLPAYVELCWLMMVLVPPGTHVDRPGELVDYCSWRLRGWCRLEYMAAILSRNSMLTMVVKGPEHMLEFLFSNDVSQLVPGQGQFSCCAAKHNFGHGTVPCDKIMVHHVLNLLLQAKIAHLKEQQLWFETRYFASLQQWLSQGLCLDAALDGSGADLPATAANVSSHDKVDRLSSFESLAKRRQKALGGLRDGEKDCGRQRLRALKQVLGWRDDASEAELTKETGVSLLFWAATSNDLPSAKELVKDASVRRDIDRGLCKDEPERATPRGINPLISAMMYARWELVEVLLDSGADPQYTTPGGFNALMGAAVNGRSANVQAWLQKFPNWNIEQRESVGHLSALGFAVAFNTNQLATVQILLEAGAKPHTLIMHHVAMNPDAAPELVQWLLDFQDGKMRPKLHLRSHPPSLKIRMLYKLARICLFFGSERNMVAEIAFQEGATPVHFAAFHDDLSTARVFAAAGCPLTTKNAYGQTPLDLVRQVHRGEVPLAWEECLSLQFQELGRLLS
jgi:ankyrin repeat protein